MVLSVTRVQCNLCDVMSHAFDGAIYKPSEIRTELKNDGWTRTRSHYGGLDLCPKCTGRLQARKKAA